VILLGDVGGTKVRLALVEEGKELQLMVEETFLSREFASFEQLLKEYLKKGKGNISYACFGVAGPVLKNRVKTTNIPWVVDGKRVQRIVGCKKVILLNDLVANAYGIFALKKQDFWVLQKGKKLLRANGALLSCGTGLGEAGLYWDGKKLCPLPSEGGHVDFSCKDLRDWELFSFLQKKFGHVSQERILSGSGLVQLFLFLSKKKKRKTCLSLKEIKSPELSRYIVEKAKSKEDLLCEEAVLWFCSLWGREAGNMALKFLALGGVFLSGGLAPALAPMMKKSGFLSSFKEKGRFSNLLRNIPIKVILNEKTPLLGAGIYVKRIFQTKKNGKKKTPSRCDETTID
jgi:glucokinase